MNKITHLSKINNQISQIIGNEQQNNTFIETPSELTQHTNANNSTEQTNISAKNYKVDSIVNSVINKFIERAKVGKEKYGTDLDRTDLALYEWILHAQEEHMDAILYLEKIKKIIVNNS